MMCTLGRTVLTLLFVVAGLVGFQDVATEVDPWHREEVGIGVDWRYRTYDSLYGSKQSVSVLEVDLKQKGTELRLVSPGKLEKTSVVSSASKAVGSVNGGYFQAKGVAAGVLRIDGEDLGTEHRLMQAALVLGKHGKPSLVADPDKEWTGFDDVMAAGPMLVEGGEVAIGGGFKHETVRHPRTAIGLTKAGRVLFVTVDGRTKSAAGMSLDELARLMVKLGCERALNLDGGGSTTMWVRSEGESGIVSYPCDNRLFDRAGERAVGNVILVEARDVIVKDDHEAERLPEGSWTDSTEGRDYLGRGYAASTAGDATARWMIPVEFDGQYDLYLRWPREEAEQASLLVTTDGKSHRLAPSKSRGEWVKVTRLELDHGAPLVVELKAVTKGRVVVDGLRLEQR